MYKLPTFEEALAIKEANDSFLYKTERIGGYDVHQFSYRLAGYEDFEKFNAHELRGLTYVLDDEGTPKRYLMLHKFYSMNQTIGYMHDDVKDKTIVRIQDKLDGSIIRFIKFPDGKVRAKSKFSFESEQAQQAQRIYESDQGIHELVNESFQYNLAAMFELIGPFNRIVLGYPKTELRLIQVRNEEDGEYFDISDLKRGHPHVNSCDDHPLDWTLDELVQRCETEQGYEGFVIQFDDGQFMKLKTHWYLTLHHLITEAANRADYIVTAILNEEIDDFISQIPPDQVELREYINDITHKVSVYFNECVAFVNDRLGEFDPNDPEERKQFAIKWSGKHELFGTIMRVALAKDVKDAEYGVKQFIMKRISGLKNSEKFVKDLGINKIPDSIWRNSGNNNE